MRLQLASVVGLTLVLSCVHRLERAVTADLTTVDHKARYLKAHMRNGDLYVLSEWHADEPRHRITGRGEQLGADRAVIRSGTHEFAMTDVALYETNEVALSPSIAAMAVVTGMSIALSVVCLANPKACFGSCPTFYAPAEPGVAGGAALEAEGFSDAIAPSLERHDIDALWRSHVRDGHLTLRMTNEAYETHVVKRADVLAVPRPVGTRVVSTGETLWLVSRWTAPEGCRGDEGDCTAQLAEVDGVERTSLSDPHDLAARETLELAFPPGEGRAGVVIAARQSLVTTFLLYQGLSYLGTTAASWLASLERGSAIARGGGETLQQLVGGIEVQIARGAGWDTVGEVYETGPIATDVHLVVLPAEARGERVRLRLPRGGWRIDHVARVTLEHVVEPQRIAPRAIRGTLGREYGAGRMPATGFPIVTQPGDAYELDYEIPRGDVELFLDSRGYYLEWMRAEWLRDEQPLAALGLLLDPARALRELAPAWKRMEPQAEELFWRSRYARP